MQQATITEPAGAHVVFCAMSAEDGRDHHQLGMVRVIRIVKQLAGRPGSRRGGSTIGGVNRRAEPELWVCHLGVVEYRSALELQTRIREARQAGWVPDVMLLLEHPPVYTRGRRSGADELPMGEEWYRLQGIDVIDTDRGGKVTYHGPGQLVGYPIVAVGDVVQYVRTLERGLVVALDGEGVRGRARADEGPDYTGVWVGERKIASIGVHVARGVTTHGFAVNVENDLQPFGWVVACGLPDVQMTSLTRETGRNAGQMKCFRRRVAFSVAEALGRRQRLISLSRLERRLAGDGSVAPLAVPAAS
jgi:lipoyl(octanoyl) transferase